MKRDFAFLIILIGGSIIAVASLVCLIFSMFNIISVSSGSDFNRQLSPIFLIIVVIVNILVLGASMGYFIVKRK